jgi:hypothetical protein
MDTGQQPELAEEILPAKVAKRCSMSPRRQRMNLAGIKSSAVIALPEEPNRRETLTFNSAPTAAFRDFRSTVAPGELLLS